MRVPAASAMQTHLIWAIPIHEACALYLSSIHGATAKHPWRHSQ